MTDLYHRFFLIYDADDRYHYYLFNRYSVLCSQADRNGDVEGAAASVASIVYDFAGNRRGGRGRNAVRTRPPQPPPVAVGPGRRVRAPSQAEPAAGPSALGERQQPSADHGPGHAGQYRGGRDPRRRDRRSRPAAATVDQQRPGKRGNARQQNGRFTDKSLISRDKRSMIARVRISMRIASIHLFFCDLRQ